MADLEQLKRALVNADRAGDTAAAMAFAKAIRQQINVAPRNEPKAEKLDPTEGMSTTQKVLAGTGKAMVDAGRGVGQMVGLVDQKDIDEAKKLDAPLMNTGAGTAGNILGNIATLAPTAFIPGANTVRGAALINAIAGGVLTPGTLEDRGQSALFGGAGGAAGIGAGKLFSGAGRAAKAAAAPLTESGRNRIVGEVMRRAAGENVDSVIGKMSGAAELVPGSVPTAAEVAESGGIASLQRAMSAANPEAYTQRGMQSASARVNALRGIAGDEQKMQAAIAARDGAADTLYGKAFQSDAMRRDLAKQAALDNTGMSAGGAIPVDDALSPGIRSLLDRPVIQKAIQEAKTLAANMGKSTGKPLDGIVQPGNKSVPMRPQNFGVIEPPPNVQVRSALGDAMEVAPDASAINALTTKNNPATIARENEGFLANLENLHYLKMAIDEGFSNPQSSLAAYGQRALSDTKSKLLKEMESISPTYGNARKTFADMSTPINQMQVGQELITKMQGPLADHGALASETGSMYARALNDVRGNLVKNATGGIKQSLEDVMTPQQMATLNNVAQDLARKANAQNLGRGTGSNTFQNFAMDNLAAQSGMPSAVSVAANLIPGLGAVGSMAKATGNIVYKSKDELMKQRMADLLLNPQAAAGVMEKAVQPGRIGQALQNSIGPQNVDRLMGVGSVAPGVLGSAFALPYGRE